MMKPDKIQKFYSSCHEYLEKKHQIEQMTLDLKCILHQVNDDLNDIVDNGLSADYLAQVAYEYKAHKFESSDVQEFIDKIDKLLFANLDSNKKDRLEIVSLRIHTTYHHSYSDAAVYIDGPVAIDFIDTISDKSFTVLIPVKDCTKTDVLHWAYDGNGLYIVSVDNEQFGPKDICRVFDPSKVSDAVEKLIDGAVDDDLNCIDVSDVLNYKYYNIHGNEIDIDYDMSSFLTNTVFADEDYGYNCKKCISNCIDDTRNFK